MKTWDTPRELGTVMPLKIRAFPDWRAGSEPTYLRFGYPESFKTTVDLSGVPPVTYQWVTEVENPLADVLPGRSVRTIVIRATRTCAAKVSGYTDSTSSRSHHRALIRNLDDPVHRFSP